MRPELVHHRRLGERLGQEDDFGRVDVYLRDEPFPEVDRLGVWIVDPENGDPVRDPETQHPQGLRVDPGRVVVEVHREDVLVLLRGVLGVRDRSVGPGGEPLGVLGDPRVVGGALQRKIESHLEAETLCGGDEVVEVLDAPQLGVHRIVSARRRADGPRRTDISRIRVDGAAGLGRTVAALAVHFADGMDGGEIDDVERHARRSAVVRRSRRRRCRAGAEGGPRRPGRRTNAGRTRTRNRIRRAVGPPRPAPRVTG